jgi:hypothetical protein
MSRKRKRERKKVEHAFGPAYGNWLDYFELLEDLIKERYPEGMKKFSDSKVEPPWSSTCLFFDPEKVRNTDLNGNAIPASQWSEESKNYYTMCNHCFHLWGQYAQPLRNAFKFKVTESHFYEAVKRTSDPIEITSYLPFESVFIQVTPDETWGSDRNYVIATGYKELLLCERQPCREDYPELGLKKGETFICLTPAVFVSREGMKRALEENHIKYAGGIKSNDYGVRLFPVELHVPENQQVVFEKSNSSINYPHWRFTDESRGGLNAYAKGADPTDWIEEKFASLYLIHFFNFLWLLNFKESKQTLRGRIRAENVIRRKPKHRKKHPVYEYSVLELDLKEDEPSTNLIVPRECAKKRQHMVRGFWRKYKEPLKSGPYAGQTRVFVKEHWRGDKTLGVVRKDYIFNDGENNNESKIS